MKNDILYIDSGVQKWNGTDVTNPILGINSYMITIPLNSTWDWKSNITMDAQAKNVKNPTTGTPPPSLIRGHMFHGPIDQPNVYVYGGTTFMGNQSFEAFTRPESSAFYPLWSYTYGAGNSWDQYSKDTEWTPNHGAATEAIDQGLAFYLNGQIDWGTAPRTVDSFPKTEDIYVPMEGMVVLDLKSQSAKNISTSGLRGGAPRVGGTMEYFASIGGMGALVALGGQVQPNLASPFANVSTGLLIDFETVDMFDIDSYLQKPDSNGTWYSQNTTGDVPEPRIDFCTVAISSPDNSSHHIYLYGGRNPITNKAYDDVVVLTLPSFNWTSVWPLGESPRWGHKCHVAGKRQMITVGGNTPTITCDWETKGVAVWDMTALRWGSVFAVDRPEFQVPNQLLAATGGNANGNATKKEPAMGWTEQGLKTVFATPSKTTPSSGTTSGNTTPGNTSSSPSPKKKSMKGAIAGGAGGGVAGLIIIVIVAFFLRRRYRKRHSPHELPDTSDPSGQGSSLPKKYELHAVNENSPAELYGYEIKELETPRQAVEADPMSSPGRAELSGTNTAPGALHGVPIVRTPGDDLPERPEYVAGLRRPSRERRRSASVTSNERSEERADQVGTNNEREDNTVDQKSRDVRVEDNDGEEKSRDTETTK